MLLSTGSFFRPGAGGGGGGGTVHDYFAATGATTPIIGATWPASFYDATSTTTWYAWEAWNGTERLVQLTTYNHTTALWSPIVTVADDLLTDDDHGTPAICMDDEGFVHCFYGPHIGPMQRYVTQAARDPSKWNKAADISTNLTYPHPLQIGTVLYMLARGNSLSDLVLNKTSTLVAGVATWAAQISLVQFSGARIYFGPVHVVGTDIHIIACWSLSDSSERRNVYHFVYDTTTGALKNSDGSTSTAAGSLPISKATADASYRVVNQPSPLLGEIPVSCFDSSGDLNVVYLEGTGSPYNIRHVKFTSGAWTSPVTITTIDGPIPDTGFIEMTALVPLSGGNLELWYPEDSALAFTHGGNMNRVLYASGSWGSPAQMLAHGSKALARPEATFNAHADARMVFTEIAQTASDSDAGGLKLYAHGDGGFLQRPMVAPTDLILSSTTAWDGMSVGDVIGQLFAVDTDYLDTFTWTITADPDSKFSITGNELKLAATVSYPNSHSVTIRAADSDGQTRSETFSITVVDNAVDRNDTFYSSATAILDTTRPAAGTDASIANVKLLVDVS